MPLYNITPDRDRPNGWQALSFFGIPIYIEVGFLMFMGIIFLMQARGGEVDFVFVGLLCFVIFFSLLVHELGHALTARAMGCDNIRIALIMFGGYATHSPTTPIRSIVITFAGPVAGGTLGVAAFIASMTPLAGVGPPDAMSQVLFLLVWLNLLWTAFNLIPIHPLDGGQILLHALTLRLSPSRSMLWTARVSMVFSVLVAIAAFKLGFTFAALFCAFFFMNNFRTAQALG